MVKKIEVGVNLEREASIRLHGISRTYGGISYAFAHGDLGTLANGLLLHEMEIVDILNIAYAKGQSDAKEAMRTALGVR